MLNSLTGGTAAGNAFYASVQLRLAQSREARIVLNEVLSQMYRQEPDYTEIVRQLNLCLAQVASVVNRRDLIQQLRNIPLAELENLLKKLQKMRPSGSLTEQICEKISPEAFLNDPGIFFVHDPD
jgi:hypothetical protein